jgi:hypothetical protein
MLLNELQKSHMIIWPKIRNYREHNYKPETKERETLEHMQTTRTAQKRTFFFFLCLSFTSASIQELYLTNSVEMSTTREATSCAATW